MFTFILEHCCCNYIFRGLLVCLVRPEGGVTLLRIVDFSLLDTRKRHKFRNARRVHQKCGLAILYCTFKEMAGHLDKISVGGRVSIGTGFEFTFLFVLWPLEVSELNWVDFWP